MRLFFVTENSEVKSMAASSGHKNISRIDHAKKYTHGWYVRITFGGTQHAKFFGDEAHGGRERALEKAVRFRNNLERKLGKPRTDRLVIANGTRSTTGIIGVHRRLKSGRTRTGKRTYSDVFEVTWSPKPGVVARTTISIEKYGEREAFRRACGLRRKKEREMYGSPVTLNWASGLSKLFAA